VPVFWVSTCIDVVHIYNSDLGCRKLIFVSSPLLKCEPLLGKNTKRTFKNLLLTYGYSWKVADELWKWYNFSEKKGVASF
jgi:hypothetical protein